MFKKIVPLCLLLLAGCASSQPQVPTRAPVVVAKTPALQVLKTANYSVSVPADFINVKVASELQLDFVYKSPDGMLILTLTTDQTVDNLDTYSAVFADALISNGAELIQAKEGTMGGLRTVLLVMGMNRRFLSLNFLTQDDRVQSKVKNVYYVSCAINPLMLKDKAAVCLEITKSFAISTSPDVKIRETSTTN